MATNESSTKSQAGSRKDVDNLSLGSSVEQQDALIDKSWFWQGDRRGARPTGKKLPIEAGVDADDDVYGDSDPFYSRWYQSWQERSLYKRLDTFDVDEVKTFVAQKLFKVDGIICDEQAKLLLIERMVINPQQKDFAQENEEIRRRHGAEMVRWLRDRLIPCTNQSKMVLDRALKDFNTLKQVDPLSNWWKQSTENSSRMLGRIQNLAGAMAEMVQYSFLMQPGMITPHLSEFVGEFRKLETFFERNDMSQEELSQQAFRANYLTKARSPVIECIDATRIVLRNELGQGDDPYGLAANPMSSKSPAVLFCGDDVPVPFKLHSSYGTSDFIHASAVRGGPLMNTFICTQAPMPSTIDDFWQMVWQEGSQYIFMLCGATDHDGAGPVQGGVPNTCPYYWPRMEGDEMRSGPVIIRNERIDGTLDPLFNVTYLSMRRADDSGTGEKRLVQHWQYDWNDFSDSHWPLRILRRSRLASTPTIIQCMDGCGRSGTLVCIEALLMHVLRGSAQYDKLVFTTALFVRLQRRHAIASPLQYLFIYRTLLYWMQPYVTSVYHRFLLGLTFPQWGFVGKYDKLVAKHAAGVALRM